MRRTIILMLAISTPLTAFAMPFDYDFHIEHAIAYAETQLDLPDHHAIGASELETDEERYIFWSGWWHAMRQMQFTATCWNLKE